MRISSRIPTGIIIRSLDPIYVILCHQFPDDSDYFDGSGSGAGFQEDFEFLEVQTFDDKNATVQNEPNINGTFNFQFNPEVAINSNNSTEVINVQNNSEKLWLDNVLQGRRYK